MHATVAELLAGSPEFARLWDRYDVRAGTNGVKAFDHPEAGRMTLGTRHSEWPEPTDNAWSSTRPHPEAPTTTHYYFSSTSR